MVKELTILFLLGASSIALSQQTQRDIPLELIKGTQEGLLSIMKNPRRKTYELITICPCSTITVNDDSSSVPPKFRILEKSLQQQSGSGTAADPRRITHRVLVERNGLQSSLAQETCEYYHTHRFIVNTVPESQNDPRLSQPRPVEKLSLIKESIEEPRGPLSPTDVSKPAVQRQLTPFGKSLIQGAKGLIAAAAVGAIGTAVYYAHKHNRLTRNVSADAIVQEQKERALLPENQYSEIIV